MKDKIKKFLLIGSVALLLLVILLMGAVMSAVSNMIVGNAYEQEATLTGEEGEEYEGDYNGGQFTWPVPGITKISSDYGWRICPFHGREFHSGIDISSSAGKAVVAAEKGRVVHAAWNGSYGKCVIISHGGGLYSLYGHLQSISVRNGQDVFAGVQIGKVGSTGNSTGPHLHFEVRVNANSYSSHTSPWNYLKK